MNAERGRWRWAVTWRSVILGLVLIVPLNYWDMAGLIWRQGRPNTVSLYFNVIFFLSLLVPLNLVVRRLRPRLALLPGELLVIYAMLSVASSMSSLDVIQPTTAVIAYPYGYLAEDAHARGLFFQYLSDLVVVKDTHAAEEWAVGGTSLYLPELWRPWVKPVVWWSVFLFLLTVVMLAMCLIVRRDWTERSHLSFPILELPTALCHTERGEFRRPALWVGFCLSGLFSLVQGLRYLHQLIPNRGGYMLIDTGPMLTEMPWKALGWTPVVIYPFAVGLAYFIPLDLAFSCWAFYLFFKFEKLLGGIFGWYAIAGFPFLEQQGFGGYMAFAAITLYLSRYHLRDVFRCLLGERAEHISPGEARTYRWASLAILLGFFGLVGLSVAAGMSPHVAIVFFLLYFILSLAITRMRAEVGSPVHDLHFAGPHRVIVDWAGPKHMARPNLVLLGLFQAFNRAYRGHPMPHQLEGLRAVQVTPVPLRIVGTGMTVAAAVGIASAFWALLDQSYKWGGRPWYGQEATSLLMGWLQSGQGPGRGPIEGYTFGFFFTLILALARLRFLGWVFNPVGFAVSGSWSMNLFWVSILAAWLIKRILLHFGGIRLYRKGIPFFLGLVLGEFTGGALWSLYGIYAQTPCYNFLP